MGIIHEKELKGAVEGIPNEVEKIDPEKRKEKPEQLGEDKKGKEEIAPVATKTSYRRLRCTRTTKTGVYYCGFQNGHVGKCAPESERRIKHKQLRESLSNTFIFREDGVFC
ncbi:uncharacterized protein ACN2A1_002864 isoform 1-T1 [Glossina fuscipes fuscipes]